MNSKTTIIGLVAAIAVLSGAMGLSVTGAFSDITIAKVGPTNAATGFLMGQVMIEAHNADGELIAYRLGDNEVVDDGEQCILKMLFGTSGGLLNDATDDGRGQYTSDAQCSGILTGAWDIIGIGTGTLMCPTEDGSGGGTAGDCDDQADQDLLTVLDTELVAVGSGLVREYATTKTWTNGTGDSTPGTSIILKKTFTSVGVAADVTESGLFNSTTVDGSGMLAHKTFAAVSLAAGDSITVQWTFTVGD